MTDRPTPDYLLELNDAQYKVACHLDGPCLVVAGAGSGKTRSVVARVQCLIDWYGVHPNDILCITFTRKAAAEMRERIVRALDEDQGKDIQVRTFHSTGVKLCRSYSHLMGLNERISIWDEKAAVRQMKLAMNEVAEEAGVEGSAMRSRCYTTSMLHDLLDEWKQTGKPLDKAFWDQLDTGNLTENMRGSPGGRKMHTSLSERISNQAHKKGLEGSLDDLLRLHLREMKESIKRYEKTKQLVGAVDLTDLIWLPVVHSADPMGELLDALGERWKYVIVDEYQDTNDLQEKFIKNLVHKHRNLMVVGDDDQAIYGWRGSNVKLITTFSDRWDSSVIRLGENYRCRAEIVDCAAASIVHNKDRVSKDLWGERGYGGTVASKPYYRQDDEVRDVAKQIKAEIDSGCSPKDIAVLARRRRWVSMMHNELVNLGVPSDAVGVKAWYQRDDVRLLLSFVRSVSNRCDIDAAQQVLASWPSVGATTIQKWYGAIKHGDDVYDGPLKGLLSLPRHGRKTKKGQSIERLVQLVREATDQLKTGGNVYDLLVMVCSEMGIFNQIKDLKEGNIKANAEADYRSEGIKLLLGAAREVSTDGFDAVNDLSDEVSTLISAQAIGSDAVTVSTIHSAKGLEWEQVFVIGCADGILPSGDNIEEERRLFYVAATRARESLTMTHSVNIRGIDGKSQPTCRSQFVDEAMMAVVEEF
jgi:DNA helicase II / ATP-dependent DNA helicase PcrA